MAAVVAQVEEGSLAAGAGIKRGDVIEQINGIEIIDYLDYMYASCDEVVVLTLADRRVTIENEAYEPLGILFESMLIDTPRACHNKCVFCFIDQLPKGMRPTCYFKDDDYRLSFLQGNYVSLTNMTEADVARLIRYHIPRINISVHTTNPALRQKMLHNKRAGEVLSYLKQFADGGLMMNGQIVLCPGWNDGAELDRTISDLVDLGPCVESVSVVPVGLSDYRAGLPELKLFDQSEARAVIRQVERWQKQFRETRGVNLVYLADEFYLTAGLPIPDYGHYDGFPQIENGVGLCASLSYEFYEALAGQPMHTAKRKKTIATGVLAYGLMCKLAAEVGDAVQVRCIKNRYFGADITVTGLLTGGDLIAQLRGIELGEMLLLSSAMLRHNEPVFLDDVTVEEVERELGVPVRIVENDGYALLDALLC